MENFSYIRATDIQSALSANGTFIAGGTNLLDLMKGCVEHPSGLVDITHVPGLDKIEELPNGGFRIGATVRNSDAANHPVVRTKYSLLSQAILSGASAQLRNMATTGGNLMQRTRCGYFYDTMFSECNKREPGSGCAAINGASRNMAIFGSSPQCIATNPSDMSVALAALDAVVQVVGPKGKRSIPITDFHRLPEDTPEIDTVLQQGELIVSVDLPPHEFTHVHYLKVRDRHSFAFAVVSVAVALKMEGNVVQDIRIALGGVALKPWRASIAEKLLIGKELTSDALKEASVAELLKAKPARDNRFKVRLAQRSIVRAINTARGVQ
jgi:xanthine dehydrogenase YagS FAD-binding subunit